MKPLSVGSFAIALLVGACQSGPTAATVSPSAASASQPAAASASPVMSPSTSPVALNCKLPISDGTPGSGGFITFPAAQFAADPSSQVTVPKPGARGRTSFGLTRDKSLSKWLPVPRDWVSTDGTRYAYPSPDSILVVNAATGQVIGEYGKGSAWQPVDLEDGGIYAYQTQDSPTDPPIPASGGLWVLPFSGTAHQVENTNSYFPIAVHGAIFFGILYMSWVGSPYSGTNSLVDWRNLAGNGEGIAFSSGPNAHFDRFQVVGVDVNGYVFGWADTNELWFAKDNSTMNQLDLGGDTPRYGPNAYSVLADANGTWLAGQHGLFLLTGKRLQRVADHSGNLGGGCA